MAETKLLPCPCCGGEADNWESFNDECAYIDCKECGLSISRPIMEKAISAWNRRVPPTSEQIVEYIEKTHAENKEMLEKQKRNMEKVEKWWEKFDDLLMGK